MMTKTRYKTVNFGLTDRIILPLIFHFFMTEKNALIFTNETRKIVRYIRLPLIFVSLTSELYCTNQKELKTKQQELQKMVIGEKK